MPSAPFPRPQRLCPPPRPSDPQKEAPESGRILKDAHRRVPRAVLPRTPVPGRTTWSGFWFLGPTRVLRWPSLSRALAPSPRSLPGPTQSASAFGSGGGAQGSAEIGLFLQGLLGGDAPDSAHSSARSPPSLHHSKNCAVYWRDFSVPGRVRPKRVFRAKFEREINGRIQHSVNGSRVWVPSQHPS